MKSSLFGSIIGQIYKKIVNPIDIMSDWFSKNYDSMLVIVNLLEMMVYYKPAKINALKPVKIILSVDVRHHSILNYK